MSEEKICKTCGKPISEEFKVCPYCGYKDMEYSERNGLISLGLCVIFGYFCAHNFYAGKMKLAAVYFGLYFLIWLADLITLINGKFKDSNGKYVKID